MIVSETERREGIKVTFIKNGGTQDTGIGETITCFVNGKEVVHSEGNTVALPIQELSTVEFRSSSFYRATKFLDGSERSLQVTLFPLPASLGYHTHEQMLAVFQSVQAKCPKLSSVYDIGKSHEKRVLQVLRMSAGDTTTGSANGEKQRIKLVGGNYAIVIVFHSRSSFFLFFSYMGLENIFC